MSTNTSVDHPFLKAGTALAGGFGAQAVSAAPTASSFTVLGVPVSTMGDLAALAALTYSLLLSAEFVWRKFIRPFLEARKIVKRKFRRAADQHFHDKYGV